MPPLEILTHNNAINFLLEFMAFVTLKAIRGLSAYPLSLQRPMNYGLLLLADCLLEMEKVSFSIGFRHEYGTDRLSPFFTISMIDCFCSDLLHFYSMYSPLLLLLLMWPNQSTFN